MTDTLPEDLQGRVRVADRDRYLATLYAPPAARAGLFALFALDLELAQVVATTSEPMLGEIRLAWWREQLVRLDAAAAPAQPTLAALAAFALPAGVRGASLEPLEDAHLSLLLDAHFDGEALDRYLGHRGSSLFAAAARLLGGNPDTAEPLGRLWALGDLVRRGERPPHVERDVIALMQQRWRVGSIARPLRPLAALARLADADITAVLAGRDLAPRGTAGRQLRIVRTLLTGR